MQQPAVFGIKVFDTDESTQLSESPTRKIHRKYGNNPSGDGGQEEQEEEYYGTPVFSEESKETGGLESEQPVMTVLREMLNNKSGGLSLKDLVNISKTYHDETHFGPQSPQRSEDNSQKHNEVGGADSREEQSVSSPPPPAGEGTLYDYSDSDSDSEEEYQEKPKQIWPYRTDDQYSLFYFHPPSQDEKDLDEKEYQWPSLSEYENEYHFQPREPTKQENLNQEIALHTTAG